MTNQSSTELNTQDNALPRELTHNLSRNVCVCYDVSKKEIIETIQQGAKTLEEVSSKTYACQGSGCCIRQVERLIELLSREETKLAVQEGLVENPVITNKIE